MYFSKIKGHGDVLSNFEKRLTDGTPLSGVYLFAGPKAVGKHTVAQQLARYLTCVGVIDDECRCENCRLFPHVPDFLDISRDNEDIKVSDAHQIQDFLSLVPYRSRYRVVIINDADQLNTTASNELLKVFEDIKSNCIAIMVSSRPEQINAALLSRAYRVDFGRLSPDEMISILKSNGHRTTRFDDVRRMLPYLSQSVLTDLPRYLDYIKFMPGFLKRFPKMAEDDMLAVLKQFDDKGELLYFLEILTIYLDDLIKIKYDSPDVVANVSELDHLEELMGVWHDEICLYANERLKAVLVQYRRRLNLKMMHLLTPAMCWIYLFMQSELKKKVQTGKTSS